MPQASSSGTVRLAVLDIGAYSLVLFRGILELPQRDSGLEVFVRHLNNSHLKLGVFQCSDAGRSAAAMT